MQSKINWMDNLHGIAYLMVVVIHTTTWFVTNAHAISPVNWDLANVLNSASRVSVPLFVMIPAFSFLAAQRGRAISCVLSRVYSFTAPFGCFYCPVHFHNLELSLHNLLQKPVFYHLWFFRDHGDYGVPLIQVKTSAGKSCWH
ncbi:acyltransferase family protein [Shigella flexneri]